MYEWRFDNISVAYVQVKQTYIWQRIGVCAERVFVLRCLIKMFLAYLLKSIRILLYLNYGYKQFTCVSNYMYMSFYSCVFSPSTAYNKTQHI